MEVDFYYHLAVEWSKRAQHLLDLGRAKRRADMVVWGRQIAVQLIGRARPTKPSQVDDDVAFDCEQPGPHSTQAGIEPLAAPPSAYECLLDCIFGQLRIT